MATKQQKIIEALTIAGENGIHSYHMRNIGGLQAPVRILELKQQGYQIDSVPEKLGNTTGCRYFLRTLPIRKPKVIEWRFEGNTAIPIYG